MTNQDIFTKVKRHLLKQNEKSIGGLGGCLYRSPEGLQCAIGCLIPKKMYKPEIEGAAVGDWGCDESSDDKIVKGEEILTKILRKRGIRQQNHRLLGALQQLHDTKEPRDWPAGLVQIAKEFRLKF